MIHSLILQVTPSGVEQIANQGASILWVIGILLFIGAVLFFYFRDWHGRNRW